MEEENAMAVGVAVDVRVEVDVEDVEVDVEEIRGRESEQTGIKQKKLSEREICDLVDK